MIFQGVGLFLSQGVGLCDFRGLDNDISGSWIIVISGGWTMIFQGVGLLFRGLGKS